MAPPQKALEMLWEGETEPPPPVVAAECTLQRLGIWYKLDRNSAAMSCRDAAHRRTRLGSSGIPLWDELKSLAVSDGTEVCLVHCRADQQFDMHCVAASLGWTSVEKASEGEVDSLGLGYGLVNPFETWLDVSADHTLRQVFDSGTQMRIGVPGTMMTNAGDRTWSVEFYADELAEALPHTTVAKIVEDERPRRLGPRSRPEPIGIVTGNSPESGMFLWQKIVESSREQLGAVNKGDVSLPPVDVISIPEMGMSMELDHREEQVWGAISEAVERLLTAGASQVALACNTTQYFGSRLDELCTARGARYQSIPHAVHEWLVDQNVSRVGLVGIRYVADLGHFSEYAKEFSDIDIEVLSRRGMERIEDIAYRVKTDGPTHSSLSSLHNVLRDEIESEHILLALSELSTLLELQKGRKSKSGKILIDPLSILADRMAAAFVGSGNT